jgi:hypothetical protein
MFQEFYGPPLEKIEWAGFLGRMSDVTVDTHIPRVFEKCEARISPEAYLVDFEGVNDQQRVVRSISRSGSSGIQTQKSV